MNCKIIFGTSEKYKVNHFSRLTDLSELIESYDYSVQLRPTEYDEDSYLDEIKSSFVKNELTVAVISGSTFKAGSFVNSILKTLKIHKLDAPQYLTYDSDSCFGVCATSGVSKLVILSGIFSDLCPKALCSLGAFLAHNSYKAVAYCTIKVFGLSEETVSSALSSIMGRKDLTVSIISNLYETCYINIFANAKTRASAHELLDSTIKFVYSALGRNIYGVNSETIAFRAVEMLKSAGLKVSTAESCTGGLVSKMITDIPGSSDVFEFGIEAYSNRIKIEALGVDEKAINYQGAVSPIVAAEMAKGVRNIGESSIGIGITGVAGPAPSEGKSVGTVYIALTDGDYTWIRSLKMDDNPSREEVRNVSAFIALDLIRRYVEIKNENGLDNISSKGELFITEVQPYSNISVISNNVPTADEKETGTTDTAEDITEESKQVSLFLRLFGTKKAVEETAKEREESAETNSDTEKEIIAQPELNDNFEEKRKENTCFFEKFSCFAKKTHLNFILPITEDNIKTIIGKIAIIFAVLIFVISSLFIAINKINTKKQDNLINELRRKWAEQSTSETYDTGRFTSFSFLETYNEDIVGWLRVAGTDVSYPVVNENKREPGFYDNHNFLMKKSKFGTLHTNLTDAPDAAQTTQNTVIHGNNSQDDKMFGLLKNYRNINYYKSYSRINFKSLYHQGNYKIFAIFIINTDAKQDNGYLYDYAKTEFADTEDFLSWIQEAMARSIIITNVNVSADDRILTLATDCEDFESAKLVVMAREVRDGENYSLNETDRASVNAKPLYPQIWYDIKGGYSPYGKVTSGMFDGTSSTTNAITEIIGSNIEGTSDEESIDTSSIIVGYLPGTGTTGSDKTVSVTTVTGTTTSKTETSSSPTVTSSNASFSSPNEESSSSVSSNTSSAESSSSSKADITTSAPTDTSLSQPTTSQE